MRSFFFVFIFILSAYIFAQLPPEKIDEFLQRWGGKDSKGRLQDPRKANVYLATGAMDLEESSDGTRIWIGTEGVHLWQGEITQPILEMICHQSVVWFKPLAKKNEGLNTDISEDNSQKKQALEFSGDKAETAMVYAEGNVHFRWADHYFRGERLFFDFVHNQGIIQQGGMRVQIPLGNNETTDIYIDEQVSNIKQKEKHLALALRAKELRILSQKEFIAQDATLSPCQFGEPHYHFQAKDIHVVKFSDEIYVEAKNNHLEAFGVPFFYIPYIAGENFENWPLRSISYQKSSKWGNSLLTTWGGNLYREKKDGLGLTKLNWLLDVDIRKERGFAGGPEFNYRGNIAKDSPFYGKWKAYFVHDQPLDELGSDMGHTPDKDDEATWNDNHSLYGLYRQRFPNDWFIDFEMHEISDRNFQRDFFEKEFREDKEPETYGYARKYWDHQAATFLTQWRLNDYQSQIEYLPQGTYQAVFFPIWPEKLNSFYWSSRLEISEVKRRDDHKNPSIWDNKRVFRTDWNNALYYKFSLGPLYFLPFTGGRLSYFEQGENRKKDLFRRSAESGIEVATNFYRTYTGKSDLFQWDNVLHVFTPHIRYEWIFANSVGSKELIAMDSLEQVDRLQSIEFMLTNRLRTFRKGQISDFFWFEISLRYFFDRPDSFDSSLIKGNKDYKNFDNLKFDLLWYIRSNLWIRTKSEFNLGIHSFETTQGTIGYDISDKFSISFDHRYDRHQNSISTINAYYYHDAKWSFYSDVQYDFRESELRECKGTIRRTFHCFALDFSIKYDQVDDNTSFNVQFVPSDFLDSLKHR